MRRCLQFLFAYILAFVMMGCSKGEKQIIVGKDISLDDITEFYFTYASSTYPPDYQRYYFYAENDKHYFYHETREGDVFPLTEEYVTVSGTKELSEDEWNTFFDFLKDGIVKSRQESDETGDSGPWMYLYWKRDKSEYQEFTFRNWDTQALFEDYCVNLKQE